MSTLNTLTIAEAHKKLAAKEISAEELTRACIDRIESVDEKLNVVVTPNFDGALEEAKNIDAKGEFSNPLTGIPYLAKDIFCEKGVRTTGCSNVLREKDYVPPYSSTTTKRLSTAGAISLGKANCDEFAQGASNETSCYGPVHNPWDLERVPGGTSGGSAACVAADECIFSTGTDTGGSIRQPASLCGCVGLKVTYGRTSRYGVMPMSSSLDSIGVLSKTVEDAALWLQATAGHDPNDVTTSKEPVPDYSEALTGDIKGMTIGLPTEYFVEGIDPEVEESIRAAAKQLEKLGATVKEISLPTTKYGVAAYYIVCPSEVSSNMARLDGIRYGHEPQQPNDPEQESELVQRYFDVRSEGFGDEVKRRIMVGTYALSAGYYDAYYRKALKVRSLLQKDFVDAFQSVDAIIAPTSPFPAFKLGEKFNDPVQMYLADVCTIPGSMAGICGLSVPCGFTKDNLPIGLQILGPQWGEPTIFRVGHAYEQSTEWNTMKPNL